MGRCYSHPAAHDLGNASGSAIGRTIPRATVRMFMASPLGRLPGETASLGGRVGEDRLDRGNVEERADIKLCRQIIIAIDADEQIVF